jgi:hypothetical protein
MPLFGHVHDFFSGNDLTHKRLVELFAWSVNYNSGFQSFHQNKMLIKRNLYAKYKE